MTESEKLVKQALDDLVETARLLGTTQAEELFGTYTRIDNIFENACHETIEAIKQIILEAITQPVQLCGKWKAIETAPKETVVLVYTPPQPDDWPNTVRINFDYICPDYEDWHDHYESFEHYMAVGGPNACGPDEVATGPSEKAPYTHWMPMPDVPDVAIAQPVQPVIDAVNIAAATQTSLDKAFTEWEIKLCTDAIKQSDVTIRKPLK